MSSMRGSAFLSAAFVAIACSAMGEGTGFPATTSGEAGADAIGGEGGAATGEGTPEAMPTGLKPGADGVPTSPFGGFDYGLFRGDHLSPAAPVQMHLYQPKPKPPEPAPDGETVRRQPFHADYAAMQVLAAYHGNREARWCAFDSLVLGNGSDCCAEDATFSTTWHGFADLDGAGGADSGPLVSCGQAPSSWRVGDALASAGLRGLHIARALRFEELRNELVNGRPVVARFQDGWFGSGGLLLIGGWSPVDNGGDRFLLFREGEGFKWVVFTDLIEGREDWLRTWSDSWFRISSTENGCVPSFDPACGQ